MLCLPTGLIIGNFFDERIIGIEEARITDVTEVAAIVVIDPFPEILSHPLAPATARFRIENHLVELPPLVLDILLLSYLVLGHVPEQFAAVKQLNQHRILRPRVS